MKVKLVAAVAAVACGTLVTASAHAATTYTDLSSWESAVSSYSETQTLGAEQGISSSISLPGVDLTTDHPVQFDSIGDGWATWSGGYTGQVAIDPNYSAESLTLTLSNPVEGLGFFIEPDAYDDYTFTMDLSDGSTATATYNGFGGAGFLGFVGSDVSSLTVSTDDDFAVGDFFTATVSAAPEPSTWALMIAGLGLIGATLRLGRRRGALATA